MRITPSLEEVKAIASTHKYDVVPLSCELLSDFTTPIETMKLLKNVSTHCYMLESAQANDRWGRYTFLGYHPKLSISCTNGRMTIGGKSFHSTKVRGRKICLPLPAVWWGIFPSITLATANPVSNVRQRTARRLRTLT